ncbi:FAD assembly factor SdhE [Bacterioplanoides pacificum]|uniref:FAD assembly factor SdhE n=1 Tax=Bacterioplanoides pacificum TaxID=1171596 RepID=A0ABV7VU02_9GAMM
MTDQTSPEAIENKRTAWHSRRGMLELDVLLLPFAEQAFPDLSREDKDRYLALLDCEDPDLFTWFMEHQIPDDPEMAKIVAMVQEHARQR